jgi:microcystin degradation protein MlrC
MRAQVGPRTPIVSTFDLHANVSARMVAACNALIGYRTNPHVDQEDRGRDAARLIVRTLRGEVRPIMAAALPPLVINIERQGTSADPCRTLYRQADEQAKRPGILSNSVALGFPYADVREMGSAFISIGDGDANAARKAVSMLASEWWEGRDELRGQLLTVEQAVARAAQMPPMERPTCLLDMGDNVGGGSPADGTVLLHALAKTRLRSFVCLFDPAASQQARQTGIGKSLRLEVGGKTDRLHGEPFEADFTVCGLSDGRFEETEVRHGGIKSFDQGPTAIVETGGNITVMLTSRRMPPFSLRQITAFGIEPANFDVLVAKGVHAPVAAYAPVCEDLIRVNTPGVTTADMSQLEYRHRRRPMFPFEPETRWDANDIVMGHQA